MSWPLMQFAILAAMTHAVRAVGDRLGPRWGGLVLGLPSTTAVLLVTGGCEHGSSEAARAAEIGLLGLVAAVALPLAYGAALGRGWGLRTAAFAGVAGFVGSATVLRAGPDFGAVGGLGLAMLGVTLGCRLARWLPEVGGDAGGGSASRSFALRSAVPAVFVLALRGFRSVAGPDWAGLFATFPAMSMAVLISLHLEGGPASALKLARSMPRGNLGMIAFLAAFRASCHGLGPLGAAAVGYAAVLAAMVGLLATSREGTPEAGLKGGRGRRRFSPAMEGLMGRIPHAGPRPEVAPAAFLVESLSDVRGTTPYGPMMTGAAVSIRFNAPRYAPATLTRKVA
jgi:hypothetical protein